ncbi:Metallo-hydrolase/oxidoreductase [Calocera viscosa TUFC12733]|uniref:Metallo-hydrolase/oxidoreductase n=1 Tax=Calocera viscosa (strain TUFC12733) TaxID=1330018 RepID=A0A167PIY9_CALVF|nr:Metallo-hydrolase/oxidoreductase [Calocera viscosa TUFC12733]
MSNPEITLDVPTTRLATFDGSLATDPPAHDGHATPIASKASKSVQWVGNATCILELNRVCIMADPNFLHQGDHVRLGPGVIATRLHAPAFALEDCPPVDFILLSHLHEDHFDAAVAQKLRRSIPIVSNQFATERLAKQGYTHLITLGTWDSTMVKQSGTKKLKITSMPGKHTIGAFTEKDVVMNSIPPTMGSLIELLREEGEVEYTIYISGDTLYYEEFKGNYDIHTKYPHIDLCLLYIGGTTLPVLIIMVTMDGEQGIKLLHVVNPDKTIPIHFDDYDAFLSPLSDFQKIVEAEGWTDRVVYLDRGESYRF